MRYRNKLLGLDLVEALIMPKNKVKVMDILPNFFFTIYNRLFGFHGIAIIISNLYQMLFIRILKCV